MIRFEVVIYLCTQTTHMNKAGILIRTFYIAFLSFPLQCINKNKISTSSQFIFRGQMPAAEVDKNGLFHLVFGRGDSIFYSYSENDINSFSKTELIEVLPGLAAAHMRGPQIAITSDGPVVIACNQAGNIYSYSRTGENNWRSSIRVNDKDTVAKENLIALAADKKNLIAVWLDLRNGQNQLEGSRSEDGGRTWLNNQLIYKSPDSTICECCKPSVVIKNGKIAVMFRNWLNGNRDLYLAESNDNGLSFSDAQKLGHGSWALNGCPMDGGSLDISGDNKIKTVWNRKGKIYASEKDAAETKIGEGRGCTLTIAGSKTIYSWVENGAVVCLLPSGEKKSIGKGSSPIIKALNDKEILCVWQNEKEIFCSKFSI